MHDGSVPCLKSIIHKPNLLDFRVEYGEELNEQIMHSMCILIYVYIEYNKDIYTYSVHTLSSIDCLVLDLP